MTTESTAVVAARRTRAGFRSTVGSARWRARLVLVSFVVAWVITRTVTSALHIRGDGANGGLRLAGVHIHHIVFGLTVLLALTVAWTLGARWLRVGSTLRRGPVLFGVAWALVLDEFALVVNMRDVYWARVGDESLLAVGLFVIGFSIAALIAPDAPLVDT